MRVPDEMIDQGALDLRALGPDVDSNATRPPPAADATPVPAEVVRAERGGSYHAAAVVAMEASMRPGSPREEAYLIALKNRTSALRGVKAR